MTRLKVLFILFGIAFTSFDLAEATLQLNGEPILPLPSNESLDETKVQLGYKLFMDPRLSKNNSVSCASCHDLQNGGDDGRIFPIGINGSLGGINTPTVLNSGLNFRQFWNGRAQDLEEQVEGPIQHPKEMGSTWDDVVNKLKQDEVYKQLFNKAYQQEINKENIKKSIAVFEKALITPNSRFDQYLRGKKEALSELEITGYQRFKNYGCISCHQGVNIGGNMYQTMGVMGQYFRDRGTEITESDLGRIVITNKEYDKFVFKVPSLRNIALTAPYFHDGSAKTLEAAISTMAKYQLGRKLTKAEIDSIAAFLKTLTGELPAFLKAGPKGLEK